jgi:hypothetical protein
MGYHTEAEWFYFLLSGRKMPHSGIIAADPWTGDAAKLPAGC